MSWGSKVETYLHDPIYSMTRRFFNSCHKWRISFVIGVFANLLFLNEVSSIFAYSFSLMA